MKVLIITLLMGVSLFSCTTGNRENSSEKIPKELIGTWKLLKGTLIENKDTTITDYTKNLSFIKVINGTHFAFLEHDTHYGKDSAVFVAGGGSYSISDSLYTEHLQYCSDRQWEGNDFSFIVSIKNDTLTQYGIEKVRTAGVNRLNIEEYVRWTR